MTPIFVEGQAQELILQKTNIPRKIYGYFRYVAKGSEKVWKPNHDFLMGSGRAEDMILHFSQLNYCPNLSYIDHISDADTLYGSYIPVLRRGGVLYKWALSGSFFRWVPLSLGLDPNNWDTLDYYTGVGIYAGKLYTWGANDYGQCGLGHTDEVLLPTQVGSATNWVYAVKGDTLVTLNDIGEIWTAGWNNRGQCGTGNTTDQHSLIKAGNEQGWDLVRYNTPSETCYAIKNSRLYTWGNSLWGSRMDESSYGWSSTGDWFPEDGMIKQGTALETGWTDVMGANRVGVGINNGEVWGSGFFYNESSALTSSSSDAYIEGHEPEDTYELAFVEENHLVFLRRHRDSKIVGGFNNANGKLGRGNTSYPKRFSICYKGYPIKRLFSPRESNFSDTFMVLLSLPDDFVDVL